MRKWSGTGFNLVMWVLFTHYLFIVIIITIRRGQLNGLTHAIGWFCKYNCVYFSYRNSKIFFNSPLIVENQICLLVSLTFIQAPLLSVALPHLCLWVHKLYGFPEHGSHLPVGCVDVPFNHYRRTQYVCS